MLADVEILRLPDVQRVTGLDKVTIYRRAKKGAPSKQYPRAGTFPPPVKIGPRASGWPAHEVKAINEAAIARKTDEELRSLVRRLLAAREDSAIHDERVAA